MIHIFRLFFVFIDELSVNKNVRQLCYTLLGPIDVYKASYFLPKYMQPYTPKNRSLSYKTKLATKDIYKHITSSTTSHKCIALSVAIGIVGLLLPWIETDEATYNSFSLIAGFSGFTFLGAYAFSIFGIMQNKKKRELKNSLKLHVQDYSILVFSGAYITLGSLLLFFSFIGYGADIGASVQIHSTTSGIIFELFAGVLLCIGGYLYYNEQKSDTLKRMHIQNANISPTDRESYDAILSDTDGGKNMKLPI